ncbi:hypothetical protein DPMN_176858 [Dreissena polymorpha]|uniref:Uncharacterized protein n=1 Tax=Dreissena polymorpha TaxID=45954 RepID=A0A9D4E942_DREPO|nr:hypothetical protein DPMN_176858 [Dreissena polymorpha]
MEKCYIILFPKESRVSEVLRVAKRAFGRSAKPILIYCSTTSHELCVFEQFNIDELLLEPQTLSNVDDVEDGWSHVFLLIDHGKTSLFRTTENRPSTIKYLLEKTDLFKRSISYDDLLHLSSKGFRGDRSSESYKYTSTTEGNLTYDETTVHVVELSGNTVPLPAETHHPVSKAKDLSDENEWSLKNNKISHKCKTNRDVNSIFGNGTCTVKVKHECLKTNNGENDRSLKKDKDPKKSTKNLKKYRNVNRYPFEDETFQDENMVTSFVPSVRAVPAGTPLTNVTNTKRGVDSNPQKIKLGEKKFISDEYLRKVCDKIKKKYLRPKTKKLIHQIRKLTTIPSRVHHIILTVFPAKRSGKSGRNRNQSSSSSRPNSQIPIQASDATERDRNRPLVTSTTPVFSTGGSGTPTNPIPTTNLMDLDNERILRDRLRGVGNTVQVAPRYPEYADQIVRQRSFANWPSYTQQQAARLIIFGFYYTGI